MRTMKVAISTDVYKNLKDKTGEEFEKAVYAILPSQYIYGYGVYHVELKTVNGYHYLELEVGETCD